MKPFPIFIGYDHRQPVSYAVLAHSIMARASIPVTIAPLKLETLPITRAGLTPFSWSRFLVPWLCGFEGRALFLDADILCLTDIAQIVNEFATGKAVYVANVEPRFERAAVMAFDCGHADNRVLTPEFIETTPDPLHLITWTTEVGFMAGQWNFCVPYHSPWPQMVKPGGLIHYTAGIPIWPETKGCEFSDEWHAEFRRMNSAVSWQELMARSVHVEPLRRHMAERKAG